jgi:hypothetical protein
MRFNTFIVVRLVCSAPSSSDGVNVGVDEVLISFRMRLDPFKINLERKRSLCAGFRMYKETIEAEVGGSSSVVGPILLFKETK